MDKLTTKKVWTPTPKGVGKWKVSGQDFVDAQNRAALKDQPNDLLSKKMDKKIILISAVLILFFVTISAFASFNNDKEQAKDTLTNPTTESAATSPSETTQYDQVAAGKAVELVNSLEEVKNFKQRIVEAQNSSFTSRAVVEYDHTESNQLIVIHVYELVKDSETGDSNAHTATFDWYYIDPQTITIVSKFTDS